MLVSSAWIVNRARPRSLPLRADAELAESLDRLALRKVLELVQLPHLDLAVHGAERRREAPGPLHGLLPRLDLDERVAGHELLGLRERPVDHRALAAGITDPPAPGRGLQPGGVEQHARPDQLLVVGRHRLEDA